MSRPAISQHLKILKDAELVLDPGVRRIQKESRTEKEEGEAMTTMDQTTDRSVRKSITVKAGLEHAFQVFTEGFDTWWPRTHHIGKAPMKKAIIQGRVGGRCY